MGLEEPALSFVPLARLPPKLCWPMRAAVVLQSGHGLVTGKMVFCRELTDVEVTRRVAESILCLADSRAGVGENGAC